MGQEPFDWDSLPDDDGTDEYAVDWSKFEDEEKPEQSWGDWISNDVLTGGNALRFGIPAVGGLVGYLGAPLTFGTSLGLAVGSGAAGEAAARWYEGKDFDPVVSGVEGVLNAIPAKKLIPGSGILSRMGQHAVTGLWQGAAGAPARHLAEQGTLLSPSEWTLPSAGRVGAEALGGAAFNTAIGGGFEGVQALRGRGAPPVEATPPPPPEAGPMYGPEPPTYGPQPPRAGQDTLGFSNPPYEYQRMGSADFDAPGTGGVFDLNPVRNQEIPLDFNQTPDATQQGLPLGPYRAPNGRMTNTGPGLPPKMGPPVGEGPLQQGFDTDTLFGVAGQQGFRPGEDIPLVKQGPFDPNTPFAPWGSPPPPVQQPPSGLFDTPPDVITPPNEPPAGGGNAPIAPPITPPVDPVQAQGYILSDDGNTATLLNPGDPRPAAILRNMGFVPVKDKVDAQGRVQMVKGAVAPLVVTGDVRPQAPPTQTPARALRGRAMGPMGAGVVAATDVHVVPSAVATKGYIKNLERAGYDLIVDDGTTATFKKTREPDRAMSMDQGDQVSQMANFGDEGRGPLPGETTGRVAPFARPAPPVPPQETQLVPLGMTDQIHPRMPSRVMRLTDPMQVAEQLQHWSRVAQETKDPVQLQIMQQTIEAARTRLAQLQTPPNEGAMTISSGEPPPAPPSNVPPMHPLMQAQVESQGGPRTFEPQVPPQQPQLLPMEVGPQGGMSEQDRVNLRAGRLIDTNFGQPLGDMRQPSMIDNLVDAEAGDYMRNMGIDPSGRHGNEPMSMARPESAGRRIEGLKIKINEAYRRGDMRAVIDLSQQIAEIENPMGMGSISGGARTPAPPMRAGERTGTPIPWEQTKEAVNQAASRAMTAQYERARALGIDPTGMDDVELANAIYAERQNVEPSQMAEGERRPDGSLRRAPKQPYVGGPRAPLRNWEPPDVDPVVVQDVITNIAQAMSDEWRGPFINQNYTQLQGGVNSAIAEVGSIYGTTRRLGVEVNGRGTGINEPIMKVIDALRKLPPTDRVNVMMQYRDALRSNMPMEMRVPGPDGNIAVGGADEPVLDMLGTALYTRDRPATSVKELFQNAADELKQAGRHFPIRIAFRYGSKNPANGSDAVSIVVQDFGRGMTPDLLYTVFTDVGKSGKRDVDDASGGFGFAKAAPLLGGDYVQVSSTVREGNDIVKYVFEGSPAELKKQTVGVPVERFIQKPGTKTGFKVEVFFPKDKSLYSAERLLKQTVENSPGMKDVEAFTDYEADPNRGLNSFLEHGKSGVKPAYLDSYIKELKGDPIPGKKGMVITPGAEIDIHFELDNKERSSGEISFLNNGLFALQNDIGYGQFPRPHVPGKIVANVRATVKEGAEGYPYGLNREELNREVNQAVRDWINTNITQNAEAMRLAELQKVFDDLKPVRLNRHVIMDSGKRYTPQELANLQNDPRMNSIAVHMEKMLNELNNLFPVGIGGQLGRTVKFGWQISDVGKGGINIPSPKSPANAKEYAILINPFGLMINAPNPRIAANMISHAVLHEFNHNLARNEGGDFTWKLLITESTYGDRRYEIADTIHQIITDRTGDYDPGILKLLQEYQDARGRPDTEVDTLSREAESLVSDESGGSSRVNSSDGDVRRRAIRSAVAEARDVLTNRGTAEPNAVVEKFRKLPDAKEDWDTMFILPDGTRKGHTAKTHDLGAQAVGSNTTEALNAGIMRYAGNGVEVGAPITHAQADYLRNTLDDDAEPDLGNHGEMWVDVRTPDGEMKSKRFSSRDSSSIRIWVNSHFADRAAGMSIPVSKLPYGIPPPAGGNVPPTTPPTTPPSGGPPEKGKWEKTKETMGWGQGNKVEKPETKWIKEILALPSAATTTLDFSAPGRQGLSMILTPQFRKAALAMFKGLSKEGFDAIDADLQSKPIFQKRINPDGTVGKSYAEEIGMKLFRPASEAPMNQRAQATASKWLETGGSIPYLSAGYRKSFGKPIRASNRAFITFLNHLNANRTEYLLNKARDMAFQAEDTGSARPGIFKQKFTPEQAQNLNPYENLELGKEIADFVNTATGHGPLKTHYAPWKGAELSLESAAETLGSVLFSPGLLASRIRMLNPNTYIMATPFVRKQYAKAMLSTVAAWAVFTELAKMGGAEVSDEETSADYGKVKIGDTRIDPGGGFLQFYVLYHRMYQGGYTSSATNEFHRFGEGFQAETQLSNLMRFGSNKLNPVMKFAYDAMNASEYNPFHQNDRILQLAAPLFAQDILSVVKENPEMIPWLVPMMFGVGAQTYSKGESVGKIIAPENDVLRTGGGVADLGPDYIHPKLEY